MRICTYFVIYLDLQCSMQRDSALENGKELKTKEKEPVGRCSDIKTLKHVKIVDLFGIMKNIRLSNGCLQMILHVHFHKVPYSAHYCFLQLVEPSEAEKILNFGDSISFDEIHHFGL